MLEKKTIRYKKLPQAKIDELMDRIGVFGDVSYHNTETCTLFFLLTNYDDAIIIFSLLPSITDINSSFFLNNIKHYG